MNDESSVLRWLRNGACVKIPKYRKTKKHILVEVEREREREGEEREKERARERKEERTI